MNRFQPILALIASLLIASCGSEQDYVMDNEGGGFDGKASSESVAVTASRMSRSDGMAVEQAAPVRDDAQPAQRLLARRFDIRLESPAAQVSPLFEAHQTACASAGPDNCYVVSASLNEFSRDSVSASLSIRGAPEWIETLRASLSEDLDAYGARIVHSSLNVDDMTNAILDVRARLDTQRALLARLTELLETEGSKLSDLISLEREIARVQADIESAESRLQNMERQVFTERVDLNYTTQSQAITRSAFEPLAAAWRSVVRVFMSSLGGLILFIAGILPWLIPGAGVLWLLLWLWRRVRKSKMSKSV